MPAKDTAHPQKTPAKPTAPQPDGRASDALPPLAGLIPQARQQPLLLPPAGALRLQRALGNQAVAQIHSQSLHGQARIQRGKKHPDLNDSGKITLKALTARSDSDQTSLNLAVGFDYDVDDVKDGEVKIFVNDNGQTCWVAFSDLLADQKAQSAAPKRPAQTEIDPRLQRHSSINLALTAKKDLNDQASLTLIIGHTYDVVAQKDQWVQIMDNDDGAQYWVASADLLANQAAPAAAASALKKVNRALRLHHLDRAGGGSFEAPKDYAYTQTAETRQVQGAVFVKVLIGGQAFWAEAGELQRDQANAPSRLDLATAPTQQLYPEEFRKRYGYAQGLDPAAPQPALIIDAAKNNLVFRPQPFTARPPRIGVLPSGHYLWGKVTVKGNLFDTYDFVPESPWRGPTGIEISGNIPDGEYWMYEAFDNTFTAGAEAEHNDDFSHAFELSYGALNRVFQPLGGQPLEAGQFIERLRQALPEHLRPKAFNGQDQAAFVDATLAQTKAAWEALASYSGFTRDVDLFGDAPSHGTVGYTARLVNGNIVLSRVTNKLKGRFSAQDYLTQALKHAQAQAGPAPTK